MISGSARKGDEELLLGTPQESASVDAVSIAFIFAACLRLHPLGGSDGYGAQYIGALSKGDVKPAWAWAKGTRS